MPFYQRQWRTLLAAAACGCLTIFAACSPSSVSGVNPTPTPTSGTSTQASDILNHAKNANLRDASFTIAVTANASSTNATANGTGKLTSSPARTDLQFDKITLPVVGTV